MIKISIITATYNRGHVIENAIKGVLQQKYSNYEYIIIDGASQDNTVDILKEYEIKFDGKLTWVSEPDKGMYDAINKGIRMATGDVVGIINSDDFFHRSDAFDIIAKAFEDGETEAIYGDSRLLFEDGREKISSCAGFRTWMYRIGMMPGHQSFYAKRYLFEKYGYYKLGYKIAADFELMTRFMYVNKVKAKYISEAYFTFSMGGISTQMSNKLLLNKETLRALKENGLFACTPMIWLKYFFKIKKYFF
jgi:glycosyltransferase involved in cell wall biosynthesis